MQQQGAQQKAFFLRALAAPLAAFSKWKQDRHELMLARSPAATHWRNEGSIWAEETRIGFEDGKRSGLAMRALLHNMQSPRPSALDLEALRRMDGAAGLKSAKAEARSAVITRAYAAAEAELPKFFNSETLSKARYDPEGPEAEAVGTRANLISGDFEKGALKMVEINYWDGFSSAFGEKS